MYTLIELMSFFFIYAFLGWCLEVIYAVVNEGKFINRGFLNGPICPIYGIGMLIILLLLTPIKDNLVLLFVFSVILTTAIEFITGFILEKIFNAKWWDYSDIPFNVNGYICLKFSLYWGIACTFAIKIVHSLIFALVSCTPNLLLIILISIFFVITLSDIIVTVFTILKLKRRVMLIESLVKNIKSVSNIIGETISDKVIDVQETNEELKDKLESLNEKRKEYIKEIDERKNEYMEELKEKKEAIWKLAESYISDCKEKYDALVDKKSVLQNRIIKAFPQIKFVKDQEIFEKIKTFSLKKK